MPAPSLSDVEWKKSFQSLYTLAVEKYRAGQRDASTYFTPGQTTFLATIGHRPQEVYDFAEDAVKYSEPPYETVEEIAAVRRDYFLQVQEGKWSDHRVAMDSLPSKEAQVEGIVWLPRIIAKAKAKLRGEMPDDLMYDCGGDRKFFAENHLNPVEFLHAVWMADGEDEFVIDYVKRKRAD